MSLTQFILGSAGNSGIQPGYDDLNNLKTDYAVDVERQDMLHGDSSNNLIRGYTNIDYLSGKAGGDVLDGGGEGDGVLAGVRGRTVNDGDWRMVA
jgi:hypothetical protein